MRSEARVLLAFVGILLIALLAGCGNKTPTVQIIGPQDGAILANTAIQFTAVAEDPEDDPLTYRWLFGDGGSSTEQSVSHTYSEGGDYTVNLAVSDGKHTVQTAIGIHINIRPSLRISWKAGEDSEWNSGPIEGTAPLCLEFDGSSSGDSDGRVVGHEWVFNYRTTVSGPSCEYTYGTPGRYSVGLRVVDDLGASAEHSIDVVIHPSLAQSLETVRTLELVLSPLRSEMLTTMFPFSSELLHVQSGEVVYESRFEGIHPLATALRYKAGGCDQYTDHYVDIDGRRTRLSNPWRWDCEVIHSSISLAFAAALACHTNRLSGYSARSAKAVLGFEELVAISTQTAPASHCARVFLSNDTNSVLQLDTTKLPGALLQLPIPVISKLDRLGEEFASFLTAEQQRIDRLVRGEQPTAGWHEAEWAWATKQVRCIDEANLLSSADTIATHIEMLNTECDEFLQQIKNEVRNGASSQECEPSSQEEMLDDRLRFGIAFDDSHGTANHLRLALVYSLIGTGQESQPSEFALLRKGDAHVVRVLPHIRIETLDLEYQHPDLQPFYEKYGHPNATIIEPFYEIQYEQFALGWYVTPIWYAQTIQPISRLTALLDVHGSSFSQTAGNCTINIAATSEPTVEMKFHFEIVSDIFDRMMVEMFLGLGNNRYIEVMRGDLHYGYRVVSPGTYP